MRRLQNTIWNMESADPKNGLASEYQDVPNKRDAEDWDASSKMRWCGVHSSSGPQVIG